jgi:hypothetical protein
MEKHNKIQKTYIICNNQNPKIYQYYITSRYHSKIPLDWAGTFWGTETIKTLGGSWNMD